MDQRRTETFFAIVAPGLEAVCATELQALGLADAVSVEGGVAFSGRLVDLYRANLWSRIASRIVVRLPGFSCRSFPELYRKALRLPWGRFVHPGTPVEVRVSARRSRLMHTERISETLQAALRQTLGAAPEPSGAAQLILARIVDDQLTVSFDSSGPLLHRRGYRQQVTPAPLRETLAAGILMLLGWDGRTPLADPMCGTGSFLLEGGLLARGMAPGRLREAFAFMQWPGYRAGLWRQLCEDADRSGRDGDVRLLGSDADADAVRAAAGNCARIGLEQMVQFRTCPLADLPICHGPGLVVCNPPYGRRLRTEEPLEVFYRSLGDALRRAFPAWRKALVCPDDGLARATGLDLRPLTVLDNGGLRVGLFVTP